MYAAARTEADTRAELQTSLSTYTLPLPFIFDRDTEELLTEGADWARSYIIQLPNTLLDAHGTAQGGLSYAAHFRLSQTFREHLQSATRVPTVGEIDDIWDYTLDSLAGTVTSAADRPSVLAETPHSTGVNWSELRSARPS